MSGFQRRKPFLGNFICIEIDLCLLLTRSIKQLGRPLWPTRGIFMKTRLASIAGDARLRMAIRSVAGRKATRPSATAKPMPNVWAGQASPATTATCESRPRGGFFHGGLELTHCKRYIRIAGLPAMTINARVISGLDPGAVPGGSTTIASGPKLIRAVRF